MGGDGAESAAAASALDNGICASSYADASTPYALSSSSNAWSRDANGETQSPRVTRESLASASAFCVRARVTTATDAADEVTAGARASSKDPDADPDPDTDPDADPRATVAGPSSKASKEASGPPSAAATTRASTAADAATVAAEATANAVSSAAPPTNSAAAVALSFSAPSACLRTLTVSTGCISAVDSTDAPSAAPYTMSCDWFSSRDSSTLRCRSFFWNSASSERRSSRRTRCASRAALERRSLERRSLEASGGGAVFRLSVASLMFSARFSEIFSAISASVASSAFSSSCVSALSSWSRMSKSLVRIKLVFRIAARRSMEMISASCSSGRGGELTAPVGAPKPASAGSAVEPSATTETTSEAAAAAAPRDVEAFFFRSFSFSSRREPASRVDTPGGCTQRDRVARRRVHVVPTRRRRRRRLRADKGVSRCVRVCRSLARGSPREAPQYACGVAHDAPRQVTRARARVGRPLRRGVGHHRLKTRQTSGPPDNMSHGRRRACVATRPSRGRHHGPRTRRLRHSSETVRRARADRGRSRRAQARHTSRCPPRRRENETVRLDETPSDEAVTRGQVPSTEARGEFHRRTRLSPTAPHLSAPPPRRASSPSRRVVAASGALGNKCHAFARLGAELSGS
jgi:hypothetical protein